MLRIVLFDDTQDQARCVRAVLEQLGHAIVGKVADARKLADELQRTAPDVIIVVTRSPRAATLQALGEISQRAPRPIVLVTHDPQRELIIAAVEAGASAYVVGALTPERAAPILDAAVARFDQLQALRAETESAKAQLTERKLVERAKGILMKNRKMSEEDAYRAMRKQAMDRKLKLTEVARQIIAVANLLN